MYAIRTSKTIRRKRLVVTELKGTDVTDFDVKKLVVTGFWFVTSGTQYIFQMSTGISAVVLHKTENNGKAEYNNHDSPVMLFIYT